MDLSHQIENQNNQNNERTDEPPRNLPEDGGLMSHHELHILVEPTTQKGFDQLRSFPLDLKVVLYAVKPGRLFAANIMKNCTRNTNRQCAAKLQN